jgi:hypothetical protein
MHCIAFAGCGDKVVKAPAAAMPLQEVFVITIAPGPLKLSTELPGDHAAQHASHLIQGETKI